MKTWIIRYTFCGSKQDGRYEGNTKEEAIQNWKKEMSRYPQIVGTSQKTYSFLSIKEA